MGLVLGGFVCFFCLFLCGVFVVVLVLGVLFGWLVCFVVCLFVCCRSVLSTGMAAAELNAKQITNCKRQLSFFLGSRLKCKN